MILCSSDCCLKERLNNQKMISEIILKRICSDDFDFQIIDMNDFDFKITQIWRF